MSELRVNMMMSLDGYTAGPSDEEFDLKVHRLLQTTCEGAGH